MSRGFLAVAVVDYNLCALNTYREITHNTMIDCTVTLRYVFFSMAIEIIVYMWHGHSKTAIIKEHVFMSTDRHDQQ